MKFNASEQYRDGFADAVAELGREGDYRDADWSAAYEFLKSRLTKIKGNCKTCGGKRQVRAKSPSRAKAWMTPCPDCSR